MLGPSENIGILKDVTHEVNRKWKIYRCVTKRSLDSETMFVPLENTVYPKFQSVGAKNNVLNLPEILKDTLLEDRKVALILIDKDFNVKQAVGSYKSFLNFPEESFNFNLLRMVSSDLSVALGVAIRKSISENTKCIMKHVALHEGEEVRLVNIIVKTYLQRADFQYPFISIVIEGSPKPNPSELFREVPLKIASRFWPWRKNWWRPAKIYRR